MWRGRHVQQEINHDFNAEGENYTKRNLTRLIHTVQRLPSNRSRLDTASLWNLVGELETFSPPLPKQSVQSINVDKKPFSKKYLNLRLYPSADLSSADSSPRRGSPRNKSNNRESRSDIDSKPKSSGVNNKSKQLHKIKPRKQNYNSNKTHKKTVSENIEGGKERLPGGNHIVKSKAPVKTIHARTAANIRNEKTEQDISHTRRNTKIKENKSKIQQNFDKSQKSKPSEVVRQCIGASNIQNEFKILDKVVEFKRSEIKLESKRSTKLVISGCNTTTDQSSIVKQLTNYWNNLLNTDTDEDNVDNLSSVFQCCSSKSLEIPNEIASIQSFQSGFRISNTEIRKRHLSESNINILNRLESISSCGNNSTQIVMSGSSTSLNLGNKDEIEDNLKTLPSNTRWDIPLTERGYTAATNTSEVCNTSSSNNSLVIGNKRFDVTTDSTVKVLKNLLSQLILFPDQSILSSDIGLSQPIRTMLCLMTATLLTRHSEIDDPGGSILLQDCETDTGMEMQLHRRNSENNVSDKTEDISCNHNSELLTSSKCTTVAVSVITLKQVENALNTLALCKEFVWLRSIFGDQFRYNNEDYTDFPSQSYTFIYEHHVVLEEDDVESDQEEEECVENEFKKEHHSSLSRFINYVINIAEDAVDGVIEYIQPYLPNSIEGFVKMVYQVLVSVLIWQVIVKEFISK